MAVKMFSWILPVVLCFIYLQVTYASNERTDRVLETNAMKDEVKLYQDLRSIIGLLSRLNNHRGENLNKITKGHDKTIEEKDTVDRRQTLADYCNICSALSPSFRSKRNDQLQKLCDTIRPYC